MTNSICSGNVLDYVVTGAAVVSGQFLLVGSFGGVAVASGAIGETVAVNCDGAVYVLPKVSGTAFVQGDDLYWDDTAKNFTKTAGSNTIRGIAWKAAGTSAVVAEVRILRK